MLSLSALCLAQQHSSVRYDPASHVAKGSSGCGSKSPYPLGKTTVATGEYAGVKWTFRVYVPSSYDKSTPVPLVLQHPGWGMSAQQEEKGAGITTYAEKEGFISVTPQGMNDNPNYGGPWYSWNAVGSTQSPGPAGATCTSAANYPSYCYTSCPDKAVKAGLNGTKQNAISGYSGYSYGSSGKNCDDSPQCWWTTCDETVTPTGTGTSKVGGFIPGLYDTLEQQLCIDLTREYGSGESNGGMQTYQIGVDLHARLAAITPEFGSFHRGFAMAPASAVPVLDLHGSKDTTVPANVSLSADGYYYTTTDEIFNGGKYSSGWKKANGCDGVASHWPTQWDGTDDFWCISECSKGDVVRCMWDGGHNWLFNKPSPNGGLVTMFLLQWTKPSHAGYGYVEGDNAIRVAHPLGNVRLLDEDRSINATTAFAALPVTLTPPPTVPATSFVIVEGGEKRRHGHYSNPATGCQDDEEVIVAGTGTVCAPKIAIKKEASDDGDTPPEPKCRLGGAAPHKNGCPTDAVVSPWSRAFPTCLAKSPHGEVDPYTNGDFHCLLVCPCETSNESGECSELSHMHCPRGATCERGEMLNRAHGVCTYH